MVTSYTVMESQYIFLGLMATFTVTTFLSHYICDVSMSPSCFSAALLTTLYLVNCSPYEIFSFNYWCYFHLLTRLTENRISYQFQASSNCPSYECI